jgi:hypothetical protein
MKLKYKWSDFTLTDNSCPVQTKSPLLLREEFAKRLLITEEEQLQQQLTQIRTAAVTTITKDEEEIVNFLEKEIVAFEKELLKFLTTGWTPAAQATDSSGGEGLSVMS